MFQQSYKYTESCFSIEIGFFRDYSKQGIARAGFFESTRIKGNYTIAVDLGVMIPRDDLRSDAFIVQSDVSFGIGGIPKIST